MSSGTGRRHTVLRARIGLDFPTTVDREDVQDHLTAAIASAVADLGGVLDVLRLDLAARPDWDEFGPPERVRGQPLWERRPGGSSQA
ncbi:MAG: hypothetical protein ACRD0U_16555 [Acidimicrobiales bacterium]